MHGLHGRHEVAVAGSHHCSVEAVVVRVFKKAHGDVHALWLAVVNWMAYFFPDEVMKQQIADVALRRAQLLN